MSRVASTASRLSTVTGPGTHLWRRVVVLVPILWLLSVIALPVLVVLKVALAQAPAVDGAGDGLSWRLSMEHFRHLAHNAHYSSAYINSLRLASLTTIGCLLLGFPLALAIARSPRRWRGLLLFAALLPFFTSFLVRAYAWLGFVADGGAVAVLSSQQAILLGMVYTYLPIMVLPIYANLIRQDGRLCEAASDLGASALQSFARITLPLALPGMLAGCMLVFAPAVGEFIVPMLLVGADAPMIGVVLWEAFFTRRDWPVAAALAVVLGLLLVSPLVLLQARVLLPNGEARR